MQLQQRRSPTTWAGIFSCREPQNTGGQFPDLRALEVDLVKLEVKNLLQNPYCAKALGGMQNALALQNRAQVLNANSLSSTYKGTQGLYGSAVNQARYYANNLQLGIAAYSESSPFASRNGRTVLPSNIYLNNNFFTKLGPSQQDSVFIHELNRLNGYRGTDRSDYANITKACGTADPYGPRQ